MSDVNEEIPTIDLKLEFMNLVPFNEFPLLEKRQEKQFQYLKRVRDKIDSRISDEDIMTGYDYGIDMEIFAYDFIIENRKNE